MFLKQFLYNLCGVVGCFILLPWVPRIIQHCLGMSYVSNWHLKECPDIGFLSRNLPRTSYYIHRLVCFQLSILVPSPGKWQARPPSSIHPMFHSYSCVILVVNGGQGLGLYGDSMASYTAGCNCVPHSSLSIGSDKTKLAFIALAYSVPSSCFVPPLDNW